MSLLDATRHRAEVHAHVHLGMRGAHVGAGAAECELVNGSKGGMVGHVRVRMCVDTVV